MQNFASTLILSAGLASIASATHASTQHNATQVNNFAQVQSFASNTLIRSRDEDGPVARIEERWSGKKILAQTQNLSCHQSMDWRNVAQKDVKAVIDSGSVYTDPVYTRTVAMESIDNTQWSWARAQDKLTTSAGYSLWGAGGFQYNSLNQGYLGDCWFLSTMENLGNRDPNLVKNLFLGQDLNNSRIYGIQFYDLGAPTTVVIDDYLPFYSWGDVVLGKPSDNKGLWPMLLEKAFGKFHGNYHAVEGGEPSRSLEVMTSYPGYYKSNSGRTVDDLWNELVENTAANSFMAAGTRGSPSYPNGLVNNHAYSLFGAYKLSNGVRLVKLSNPWGVDKYTGDWSDSSSKWTDALRKEVGSSVNEEDGTFFQPIEQFLADWDGIWISKNLGTWKKSWWLNLGRDIKSSTGGTSWFCKTANCRANKFNLTSTVDQQIWIGVGTHD